MSSDKNTNCKYKNCNGCHSIKKAFDLSNNVVDIGEYKDYFEVKFKGDRKEIFLNKSNVDLDIGNCVIVKVSSGWDLGIISLRGNYIGKILEKNNKKNREEQDKESFILRLSTIQDIEKWQESTKKEMETLAKAREIIKKYDIDMKISDVEYQADGQKIFFYYVANSRVDFRELLKEIVSEFRKKIELKQIGQRQESGKINGLGSCGLKLCCSSWLKDFKSVNIDSVKVQQLSINSDKIIGSCGKLKCCMNYELENYIEKLKEFPQRKTALKTKKGEAKLIKIDVFKELLWYSYTDSEDRNLYKIKLDKVNLVIKKNEKGFSLNSLEEISEEE